MRVSRTAVAVGLVTISAMLPLASPMAGQGPALLIQPRAEHTATPLPDGRILIAGGRGDSVVTDAEIWDPTSGSFTVSGPLAEPRISPEWINFGTVEIGKRSRAHTVTVSNAGGAAFMITDIFIDPELFLVDPPSCWPQGRVPAGGSCSFAVFFAPEYQATTSGGLILVNTDAADGNDILILEVRGRMKGVPPGGGGGGGTPKAVVETLKVTPSTVAVAVKGDYTAKVRWTGTAGATFTVSTQAPGSTVWTTAHTGTETAATIKVPQGAARVRVVASKTGLAPGSMTKAIDLTVADITRPTNRIWTRSTENSSVGRTLLSATAANAKVTFTPGSVKGYKLVVHKTTEPGRIEIRVDGDKVATIDLQADTTQSRRITWSKGYRTAKARKVQVKLISGQVELDALAVTR